jgi:uncharacterized coiled-coil protein SlyX
MKVIDLLNKIANNELPNKTKFKVFSSSDEDKRAFVCEFDISYPGTIWSGDGECKWNFKIDNMRILNYEVEIAEENKPIEKLNYTSAETQKEKNKLIKEKLNQVVDVVNELKKGSKENESN